MYLTSNSPKQQTAILKAAWTSKEGYHNASIEAYKTIQKANQWAMQRANMEFIALYCNICKLKTAQNRLLSFPGNKKASFLKVKQYPYNGFI